MWEIVFTLIVTSTNQLPEISYQKRGYPLDIKYVCVIIQMYYVEITLVSILSKNMLLKEATYPLFNNNITNFNYTKNQA